MKKIILSLNYFFMIYYRRNQKKDMTNLKFFLESFWLMKRSKKLSLFLLFRGTNHPRVKPLS